MCIRPFFVCKKGVKLSPKWRKFVYWASKKAQNGPKWPKLCQNDPPKAPPTIVYLWPVQLYIIQGYLGHFGPEKGPKLAPKWLE